MCLSATTHQSIHLPAIYCHKSGERENSSSVYRSAQHPSLSVFSPSLHPIVKYQSKWSRPPIIFKPDVCFATLLTLTKVQLVLSPVTPVSEEPDSKRTPGICRSLNRPTRFTVFSIFTSLWTYIFIILYQISAEATNFIIIMCIGHWTVQRACWSSALFDLCVFFIFHPVSSNIGQWHPIFRT